MSSSLAGPDCCGGLDNIDFRKVLSALGRRGHPERVPERPRTPRACGHRPQRRVGGSIVTRQRGRGVERQRDCWCEDVRARVSACEPQGLRV